MEFMNVDLIMSPRVVFGFNRVRDETTGLLQAIITGVIATDVTDEPL